MNCIAGCNRTYYGNLGVTYNMELHRPKEDKIPYVCELNFTAAGGQHGDIIQVLYFILALHFMLQRSALFYVGDFSWN